MKVVMHKASQKLGFIIRHLNKTDATFSVITPDMGKCTLAIRNEQIVHRLSPGTFIAFDAQRRGRHTIYATHVKMIAAVDVISYHDLMWLHQICEICYYHIPLEAPTEDIFSIMREILKLQYFRTLFGDYFYRIQKIVTLRLWVVLGHESDEDFFSCHTLYEYFVQHAATEKRDVEIENIRNHLASQKETTYIRMNQWISDQLSQHPLKKALKTIEKF